MISLGMFEAGLGLGLGVGLIGVGLRLGMYEALKSYVMFLRMLSTKRRG